MKYKAILFDLDGTLLDTIGDLTYSVNLVMKDYSFPERTREEVRSFVGNGVRKLIERSLPDSCSAEFAEQATREYKAYYSANLIRETGPFSGIPEVLDRLHEAGYILGVVSNKYDASTKRLCERFFPQIDIAIGEMEERGFMRKPNPYMIEYVMRELGVEPCEVVYVGDSETDILTAQNAGVDCITVTWGFRDRDFLVSKGASHIADKVDEFLSILGELENC